MHDPSALDPDRRRSVATSAGSNPRLLNPAVSDREPAAVPNHVALPSASDRPGLLDPASEAAAEREADEAGGSPVASSSGPSPQPASSSALASSGLVRGSGEPLPAGLRAPGGAPADDVRVHVDAGATDALAARAFTAGRHIVVHPQDYAPATPAGRGLLRHELAHVAQQAARPAPTGGPVIQRQPRGGGDEPRPTIPLPGGLTLFPGPLREVDLRGARLLLPGSVRLTNALGVGPGPSAVLDVSPRLMMLHLLQNIDLSTWTRPGTPPEAAPTDENTGRISLVNPTITFDPSSGRLRGWATLSVGSDYPLALKGPTDIRVEFESSELGAFNGRLGFGPLTADFRLRLHYDTARLESALAPVFAPEGGVEGFWTRLQTIIHQTAPGVRLDDVAEGLRSLLTEASAGRIAAGEFATRVMALISRSIPSGADLEGLRRALASLVTELTHPGYTVTGGVRLAGLPISRFSLTAPTTVPLQRPLLGAPTAYPSTSQAYGVILAPPGAITSVTVPALGYTRSSYGATSGYSVTGALLPTLSPAAISGGEPLGRQFPIYLFGEVSYVSRVSTDLDLGLRFTVQLSTPELVPARPESTDPVERFNRMQQAYRGSDASTPVVPNVGLTLFGRFNAL